MTLIKLSEGSSYTYIDTDMIAAIDVDDAVLKHCTADGIGRITLSDEDKTCIVEEMTRPNTIADLIDKLDQVDGHLGTIYGGMINGY